MRIDEGDETCAMVVCSDDDTSSSDFLVGSLLADLDSISFREALKKAHAKHGLF